MRGDCKYNTSAPPEELCILDIDSYLTVVTFDGEKYTGPVVRGTVKRLCKFQKADIYLLSIGKLADTHPLPSAFQEISWPGAHTK